MNEAQLRDLKERQARVLRMLDGKTRTTELPPTDQVRLLNDLEAISALLNKANDERLVCERQRITGSKLPKTVCMTVAEKRSAAGSAGIAQLVERRIRNALLIGRRTRIIP